VIETIMNSGFQGDDIMNKKWNIIMVLMLMVPVASYALADDADDNQQNEVEINEKTQKEIEIMSDHLGAQIRLLQLEKAITKNIAKGNEVIAALKEADINTTVLEAILAELELVKEEVQSADPNVTDAVQVFIGLKADAIELSKEFRDTVRTLVDEKTQEQLRERIREMVCERVQNLSRKIQNRIRQFNRDQVQRIYGVLGETNMSIQNEYQNGTVAQEQVRMQVRARIQNMTSEKKFDVYSELAQYKIRTRIQAHVSVDNATDHFRERQEERLTNRLRMAQGQQNGVDDRVQAAMEQRMRNRLNNLNEGDSGSDNGTDNTNGSNGNDQGNSDTGNGNNSDAGNGNNDDNHHGNNGNTSGGSGRP
jgi:hypothetical protein